MFSNRPVKMLLGAGALLALLCAAGGCVTPGELLSPCVKLYNPFMKCHCIEKHAELHVPDPACYGYCPPCWRPWPVQCPGGALYGAEVVVEPGAVQLPAGAEQGGPAAGPGQPSLVPEPIPPGPGVIDDQQPIPAPAEGPQSWGPAPVPEEPAEVPLPAPMPPAGDPNVPGKPPFVPE